MCSMANAYTIASAADVTQAVREPGQKVLVTGAAGNIGSCFCQESRSRYELTMLIRERDEAARKLEGYGRIVEGDIGNLDQMKAYLKGIDTVVHLAGDPDPGAVWSDLLAANIVGTYNIMVAAKSAGCRRVIYASSIHAVSGYPADVQVKTNEPVNPGDLYGVTKCFGEAMGRYMAGQEGLSVIALRIGAYSSPEGMRSDRAVRALDAWISQRDMNQLLWRCIDVENIQFAILHGLSDSRFKRMDISDARMLVGYEPEDDAFEVNETVAATHISDQVQAHNQSDGQKSGIREDA